MKKLFHIGKISICALLIFCNKNYASGVCDSIISILNCGSSVSANIPPGAGQWDYYPGLGGFQAGKEKIFSFMPSVTGKYTLTITSTDTNAVQYFYKPASLGCNRYLWIPVLYSIYPGAKSLIGELNAGVTYLLMLDASQDVNGAKQDFVIDCPNNDNPCMQVIPIANCGDTTTFTIPEGVGVFDQLDCSYGMSPAIGREIIFSYTPVISGRMAIVVTASANSNCSYLIKDAALGCNDSGWTCIGNASSGGNNILTNAYSVTAGTTYYILTDANYILGAQQSFVIMCPEVWYPCASVDTLSCSTADTATIPIGFGAYDTVGQYCNMGLGYYYNYGREKIYSLNATVTGVYDLEVLFTDNNPVTYLIKDASSGCNDSSWQCIGIVGYPSHLFTPFPLLAGHSYLIMLDAATPLGASHVFTVHCDTLFDPCPFISTINCNAVVNVSIPPGRGKFMIPVPDFFVKADGKESLYLFTPSVSGTHLINVISHSGPYVFYFIKEASDGCNAGNWKHIGEVSFAPKAITIPFFLNAGTTYYILCESYNNYTAPGINQSFEIICPVAYSDPCLAITPITGCGVTVTSTHAAGLGTMSPNPKPGYYIPPAMGKENIYSYTPSATGKYIFNAFAGSGPGSVTYSIKTATAGCNDADWLYIGDFYNTGGNNYPTVIRMELQSGITYYILADNDDTTAKSQSFKINCLPSVQYNPCDTIYPIDCGNYHNEMFPSGNGAFSFSCGNQFPQGSELIYSFMPPETGAYKFEGTVTPGCNIYYKEASGGCNSTNWKCIAGDVFGMLFDFTDTLHADTAYYIMFQALVDYQGSGIANFLISCSANCTIYSDADGDGFGDPSLSFSDCTPFNFAGYSANNNDCVDTNASIHPGAIEICNGIDDDCNSLIDDGCVSFIQETTKDDAHDIVLYPNPVLDEFYLTGEMIVSSMQLMIMNAMGQAVPFQKQDMIREKTIKVVITDDKPGIYLVYVYGAEKSVRRKFVKL